MNEIDIREIIIKSYPESIKDLTPIDKNNYYEIACPSCGEKRAHLYKNDTHIRCNRLNNCGYTVSVWDYVQTKQGLSKQETLFYFARLSNYVLPKDEDYLKKGLAKQEKEGILESALSFFQSQLFILEGQKTLAYLKGRSYTEEDIRRMELGHYPSQEKLKKFLDDTKYPYDQAKDILFTHGFGTTHNLVIPFRDDKGCLTGFVLRSLLAKEELKKIDKPKYLNNKGLKPSAHFFNIYKNKDQEALIIVEGYLDSLIAETKGLKGVVGVGKSIISDSQIENVLSYGKDKTFILALDNDKAGQEGTEKVIKTILGKESLRDKLKKIHVFSYPEGIKDLDELIQKKGGKASLQLDSISQLNKTKYDPSFPLSWLINKWKDDYGTGLEGLNKALENASELYFHLNSAYKKEFIKLFSKIFIVNEEDIKTDLEKNKERREKKEKERRDKELKETAKKYIDEGDIEGAVKELNKTQINIDVIADIPYFTKTRLLEEGKFFAQKGKATGFKDLDKTIKIFPSELVIIGARTRHGKTDFTYNLLLNLLENYLDETFIIFSLENAFPILSTRLSTILAKKKFNKSFAYKDVLPSFQTETFNKEILEAIDILNTYGQEKRLVMINNSSYTVEQISLLCQKVANETKLGAIFVDYMELVKVSTRIDNEELRISFIVNSLRILAERLKLPVLALAQMNRAQVKDNKKIEDRRPILENLRYSGRQEQEASIVLGLFNEAKEGLDKEGEGKTETKLEIIPLKDKGGMTNKIVPLHFEMISGYISDWKEEEIKVNGFKKPKQNDNFDF